MLEKIKQWDTEVFLFLNGLHTPLMDTAMYWITDRFFWFPFYGLIIYFLIKRFKWEGVWMVIAIVLTVVLADKIASGLFKPYFARYRPCHEAAIQQLVHVVSGCGGQYGFVSSHSANTFAFALLMWLFLRRRVPYLYLLFFWALLVSYSRIYVGVHYPLDLLGGAFIGMICSCLMYLLYRLITKKLPFYTRRQT
jgi:undecaprenyl-diphosphatase